VLIFIIVPNIFIPDYDTSIYIYKYIYIFEFEKIRKGDVGVVGTPNKYPNPIVQTNQQNGCNEKIR